MNDEYRRLAACNQCECAGFRVCQGWRSNVPSQLIRQQQPFTLPGLLEQHLRRHPISHCDLLLHMRYSTSSWLHLSADAPLAGSQFAGHLVT